MGHFSVVWLAWDREYALFPLFLWAVDVLRLSLLTLCFSLCVCGYFSVGRAGMSLLRLLDLREDMLELLITKISF